jgi:hypothetical protein
MSRNNWLAKIGGILAFVVAYYLFAGSFDSHFWFPFIIIVVVVTGLGKVSLWGKKKPEEKERN